MVKRRTPVKLQASDPLLDQKIEDFANAADGGGVNKPKVYIDPRAPRNFKSIRVSFNKFEFDRLDDLSNQTGHTKLGLMRWGIALLAQSIEDEEIVITRK